jgi:transcriptional regulator with XRE-family HTH domain
MKKTNFDRYLEEQMKDRAFAERFARAGQAWDVALQIASLRRQAGLSQKDLAKALKTSQQQVSRLESPGYEGHSLSMLRRVADVLNSRVRIVFEPVKKEGPGSHAAEEAAPYAAERRPAKRPGQARRH